jgi:hypothetical protein
MTSDKSALRTSVCPPDAGQPAPGNSCPAQGKSAQAQIQQPAHTSQTKMGRRAVNRFLLQNQITAEVSQVAKALRTPQFVLQMQVSQPRGTPALPKADEPQPKASSKRIPVPNCVVHIQNDRPASGDRPSILQMTLLL